MAGNRGKRLFVRNTSRPCLRRGSPSDGTELISGIWTRHPSQDCFKKNSSRVVTMMTFVPSRAVKVDVAKGILPSIQTKRRGRFEISIRNESMCVETDTILRHVEIQDMRCSTSVAQIQNGEAKGSTTRESGRESGREERGCTGDVKVFKWKSMNVNKLCKRMLDESFVVKRTKKCAKA